MIRVIRPIGTAVMLAGLTAALLAQGVTPNLNVKMGLWEFTTSATMGGDMPMPDTSKMTPEQAAAVQKAMGSMAGPHASTYKSCLTKEKWGADNLTGQKDCKNTVTTNTATVLELTMDCMSQGNKTSGSGHFEAPSPDTLRGSFKATTTTAKGQTMTTNGTSMGKWLGADCGNVK